MSSHYLDNAAALMGRSSVSELIDALHCGVHCRIVSDSIFSGRDIVVYRSGHADYGNSNPCKSSCALIGPVAADYDQSVEFIGFHHPGALENALVSHEGLRSCRHEESSAALECLRYGSSVKFLDLALPKTVIASGNAVHLKAGIDACSYDGSYGRIHSGSVTAARKDSDPIYRLYGILVDDIVVSSPKRANLR